MTPVEGGLLAFGLIGWGLALRFATVLDRYTIRRLELMMQPAPEPPPLPRTAPEPLPVEYPAGAVWRRASGTLPRWPLSGERPGRYRLRSRT